MNTLFLYAELTLAAIFFIIAVVALVAVFTGAWWHLVTLACCALIGREFVRDIRKSLDK